MNNGPPISTDGSLARQEANVSPADEAAPGGAVISSPDAPTIAQAAEPEQASLAVLAPGEPKDAPAPVTTGVGVLIVNLGTPDAPTPAAVRRYLKEFLTDPRVIERDSLVWQAFLNGVVLPLRSRRRA